MSLITENAYLTVTANLVYSETELVTTVLDVGLLSVKMIREIVTLTPTVTALYLNYTTTNATMNATMKPVTSTTEHVSLILDVMIVISAY